MSSRVSLILEVLAIVVIVTATSWFVATSDGPEPGAVIAPYAPPLDSP